MQPGQTTQPGGESNNPENQASQNQPASAEKQYVQYDQSSPDQNFVYTGNSNREALNSNGIEAVSWQASEYISHKKTATWHISLLGIGTALAVGFYFVLNDLTSAAVIGLGFFAFAVYGSRKPGILQYMVNEDGIAVGDKHYNFEDFRSFAVAQDHGIPTIILYPTQRYLPPLSLYCSPDDFEQIATTVSTFLPETEHKPDFVEKLMSRLRF